MKHFVEWDTIDVRVDGERINALVQQSLAGRSEPIERLHLRFQNGLLTVAGSIRKFISIPFTVEIREIIGRGTTVRVPLNTISAAGLPIPTMLVAFAKKKFPPELVSFESPATLVVSLDRFLPSFVSADVQKIWIIDGGLAITLGRGGADPPIPTEDDHGRDEQGLRGQRA